MLKELDKAITDNGWTAHTYRYSAAQMISKDGKTMTWRTVITYDGKVRITQGSGFTGGFKGLLKAASRDCSRRWLPELTPKNLCSAKLSNRLQTIY